jgi:predicted alpha/beta-hydrolase family hydrolase
VHLTVDVREYARSILELQTPHGPARAQLLAVGNPAGAVVLGHGAGGGISAPDLQASATAATDAGLTAVLVEQPYRVAGRRNQPPAKQLDTAWVAVIAQLRDGELGGVPMVLGGRSAGARVACRTAAAAGAAAILCLAFPVHPPGRGDDPAKSRLGELDAVRVPVLVVQGERDPFGIPPDAPGRTVVRVPGDHSLRNVAPVRQAVGSWLATLL